MLWLTQSLHRYRQRRAEHRRLNRLRSQWRAGALPVRFKLWLLSRALRYSAGFVAVEKEPTGWFPVHRKRLRLTVEKTLIEKNGSAPRSHNYWLRRCLLIPPWQLYSLLILSLRWCLVQALCLVLRLLLSFLGRLACLPAPPGS